MFLLLRVVRRENASYPTLPLRSLSPPDASQTYVRKEALAIFWTCFASFSTVAVNYMIQLMLERMTKFEKHHSLDGQQVEISLRVFLLKLINTGTKGRRTSGCHCRESASLRNAWIGCWCGRVHHPADEQHADPGRPQHLHLLLRQLHLPVVHQHRHVHVTPRPLLAR